MSDITTTRRTFAITAWRWNGQTNVTDGATRYVRALDAVDALDQFLRRTHVATFNSIGGSSQGHSATCGIPNGHRFDWYAAAPVNTDTGRVHGPALPPDHYMATQRTGRRLLIDGRRADAAIVAAGALIGMGADVRCDSIDLQDTGMMHGPRQYANQDGPLCASWYVDGLASGGQRVRGTSRTV